MIIFLKNENGMYRLINFTHEFSKNDLKFVIRFNLESNNYPYVVKFNTIEELENAIYSIYDTLSWAGQVCVGCIILDIEKIKMASTKKDFVAYRGD